MAKRYVLSDEVVADLSTEIHGPGATSTEWPTACSGSFARVLRGEICRSTLAHGQGVLTDSGLAKLGDIRSNAKTLALETEHHRVHVWLTVRVFPDRDTLRKLVKSYATMVSLACSMTSFFVQSQACSIARAGLPYNV